MQQFIIHLRSTKPFTFLNVLSLTTQNVAELSTIWNVFLMTFAIISSTRPNAALSWSTNCFGNDWHIQNSFKKRAGFFDLPFLRLASGSSTPLLNAATGSWTQDLRLSMLWRCGSLIRRSLYAVSWCDRHSKAAMLCTNSGTRHVYVLSAWQ